MKILCLIVSFGTHQDEFLVRQIEKLQSSANHNFDFLIFCTNPREWKYSNIKSMTYDESIGFNLTLQPYIYLQQNFKNLDAYDYILYTENDILITPSNIDACIDANEQLQKHNACCGFIRFEVKDEEIFILDFTHPITNIVTVDGCDYIYTQQNVHSGCWLLSHNQIASIINYFDCNMGHTLEDRASNVYKSYKWPGSSWGIEKLIPKKDFKSLLVHHMPNKYVVDLSTPHGKLHMNNLIHEN